MAVWDFLKNALNIGENNSTNYSLPSFGDKAKFVLNNGLSKLKGSKLYQGIAGIDDKLENAFFGKIVDNPVENTTTITQDNNGNTTISSGVGTPTREGGIINDFVNGARENYTTRFNPQNLMGNDKKGFVYRLGEGIGSIGRMLESPLGRGLAVAGVVGALGGSAGDALAYGLGTTAQNQQIKANDKLYRNSLIDAEQNSLLSDKEFQQIPLEMKQQMLNEVANKYNNIKGYINPQTFNALLQAKQLQDNAEYRKMYYDNQQKQNEALEKLNRQKFEYQQKQDAIENAQKWAQIENAKDKGNAKEEAKRKQSQSTLNMIGSALEVVKNNPKAFGFIKGITPADITNRADLEGAKARAMIDSLAAEYRKYLTGAQMTEQERKHYERFLPNPRDNAEIIARKLVGMQETISAREGLFEKQDTQNLNIDTNAIDAELKKRGIK